MAHKHHRKLSVCPNCQRNLTPADNFCPNCGQENHDLRLPFGHVVYEVVEGFTHFDGKLWITLRDIFTRPGRVPLDFIEGRRQRHVPPIRLYIFVSFLLFLLLNVSFNDSQEREALRVARLETIYGADRQYREMALKDIFSLLNAPTPNLRGIINRVAIQFDDADSTGVQTIRRWRGFTDAQLDSVLHLYEPVTSGIHRERLRATLTALPKQLSWLPLRELANTKALPVDKELKKKIGIDTTLSITLRFSPGDTLGAVLYSRLKALSPAQRTQYADVNDVLKRVSQKSVIQMQHGTSGSGAYQQFSKLIDALKPRKTTDPLRFSFAKGDGAFGGLIYTTEAAARADIVRMRQMTPGERLEFYKKQTGVTKELNFLETYILKRSINRYVQSFDKSDNEVQTAQYGTAIKYVSYSFFLLMPLVAVFLYFFYKRSKKYYYVDHLIFSVNMHTVAFILLAVVLLLLGYTALGHYVPTDVGPSLLILFIAPVVIYFLLSLRTVYQQSWWLTLAKLLGLTLLYGLTFSLVLGVAFVLGIL